MSEEFRRFQYLRVIDPNLPALYKKLFHVKQWEVDRDDNIVSYAVRVGTDTIYLKPKQVVAYAASNSQTKLVQGDSRG